MSKVVTSYTLDSLPMQERQVLRRTFGEDHIDVMDAEAAVFLVPTREHAACAVRGDACNCVIAQCARTTLGSTAVAIWRTKGYLDIVVDGRRRLLRFEHSSATRELIEKYDRGEGFETGAAIILNPPKPSARLDTRREREVARRAQLKLEGRPVGRGTGKGTSRATSIVRTGTGMVATRITVEDDAGRLQATV